MSRIEAQIEAIQSRMDAATPGPWTAWDRGIGYEVHQAEDWPLNDGNRETFDKADAEFIAASKSDIAFLLDLVRKQQDELDSIGDIA